MGHRSTQQKVLFFHPPYSHLGGEEGCEALSGPAWMPLGITSIATFLKKVRGVPCAIYHNEDYSPDTIRGVISSYRPTVVGISCMTLTRFACIELARMVKQIDDKICVILGGSHPTFLDQQMLREYPEIDVIVRGEGEESFDDVIRALDEGKGLGHIAGVSYRDHGSVMRNSHRDSPVDPNQIPFLDFYDLLISKPPTWKDREIFSNAVPVEISRGCVFDCLFCSDLRRKAGRTVNRTPEQIVEHLQMALKTYGDRVVFLSDTTFTLNKERVVALCEEIQKNKVRVRWTCSTRVDLVDDELLSWMKRAGCVKIYYGIDSLSMEILGTIGKRYDPQRAVENINSTLSHGIDSSATLIFGFPGESMKTMKDTWRFCSQFDPRAEVVFRPLKIMPGSRLYAQAISEGFDEDYWLHDHGPDFPDYTGAMSSEELRRSCQAFNTLRAKHG